MAKKEIRQAGAKDKVLIRLTKSVKIDGEYRYPGAEIEVPADLAEEIAAHDAGEILGQTEEEQEGGQAGGSVPNGEWPLP